MTLRYLPYTLGVAAAMLFAAGCRRMPEGVIPPEEMAQIMADT